MKWVGLTGSMGSGKTTVSKYIEGKGIPVICADVVAREVVEPDHIGFGQVIQAFGEQVVSSNGRLDRRALGQIVFTNPEKREQLEHILHPLIQKRVAEYKEDLSRKKTKLAFYDIPLLFENGLADMFDLTVFVFAPYEICLQRASSRDGISEKEARNRLDSQMPIQDKSKLADFTIPNIGSKTELFKEVDKLLQTLTK